ncbi:MAG: hypothetical protein K2X32_13930 [Phycisphaerales bacterium]|nr:hypothetical protein [Phycisphaerales bacterium]
MFVPAVGPEILMNAHATPTNPRTPDLAALRSIAPTSMRRAMLSSLSIALALVAGTAVPTAAALAQGTPAAPANTAPRAPAGPVIAPTSPGITPTSPTTGSPTTRPNGLAPSRYPPGVISPPNLPITPTLGPALVGPGYNRPPVRYYRGDDVIRRNPSRRPDAVGPRFGTIQNNGDSIVAVPYDDRSGVSIRGDFATDNFRVGFSVNSPNVYFRRHWADGYIGTGFCRSNSVTFGFIRADRVWDNYFYNNSDPVYGSYNELDPRVNPEIRPMTTTPATPGATTPNQPAQIVPAPNTPQQPIIISAFDRGVLAIRESEFEASANALREHLRAFPRDVVAMRLLALALIGQREPAEGVALLVMAYQLDPTLAYRPVSVEFETASDSRSALSRVSEFAVSFAQKQGTSSSWLAAVVTLQGLDRKAPAARLLKRAEDNGLEARIADELRKALR